MKNILSSLPLFGAFLLALNLYAAESTKVDLSKLPPPSDKKGLTFAKDIKPIFETSCTRCHGADKPKANLRLDSLETVSKGSEHGKVVQPGKSADSKLVIAVAHAGHPDDFMPPPNNRANIQPLTKDQVALIRAWIDQGAK